MKPKITRKELIFRKVPCKIILHEYELVVTVGVTGKRQVTGSYPPWHKNKKKYLIRLLKAAT